MVLSEMIASFFRVKALPTSLFLYAVAVLTTMAGMEMFGWLSVLIALVVTFQARSSNFPRRPVLMAGDYSLLALLVVIVLSAFFKAPDSADKVFIIGNARFVLLFIAIRLGLEALPQSDSIDKMEKAFRAIVVLLGLIALYAIFQHFTGIDYIRGHREPVSKFYFEGGFTYRARGMWGHPVTFGHSMTLSLMMLLGFSIAMPKGKWKYIACASTTACGLALLWSYTRGAWIGAAAAVFVMSLYLGRKVAIASILSGVILIGGGAAFNEKFRDRLTSIVSLTNQSNTERLDVWRANIAMFKDNPVLGVGYGVNEEIIGDYYTKLGITQEFGGHAHNNYLQFLSGTGLLGFAAYTAFSLIFLWMAHQLLRRLPADAHFPRAIALGAIGAQVALHVGGLTECNFKDAEVNHQYMLILALLMVVWRRNQTASDRIGEFSNKA